MIASTLNVPRERHGSQHSINAAGLGGGFHRSDSYDWSGYGAPQQNLGASRGSSAGENPVEPFDLEKLLLR